MLWVHYYIWSINFRLSYLHSNRRSFLKYINILHTARNAIRTHLNYEITWINELNVQQTHTRLWVLIKITYQKHTLYIRMTVSLRRNTLKTLSQFLGPGVSCRTKKHKITRSCVFFDCSKVIKRNNQDLNAGHPWKGPYPYLLVFVAIVASGNLILFSDGSFSLPHSAKALFIEVTCEGFHPVKFNSFKLMQSSCFSSFLSLQVFFPCFLT